MFEGELRFMTVSSSIDSSFRERFDRSLEEIIFKPPSAVSYFNIVIQSGTGSCKVCTSFYSILLPYSLNFNRFLLDKNILFILLT